MTKWTFMMECPAGKHRFPVEPDMIMRIPNECPSCNRKQQEQLTWWKKRKALKKFRSELNRFQIDETD